MPTFLRSTVLDLPPASTTAASPNNFSLFAEAYLPEDKAVFYLYTHGAPKGDFLKAMRAIAEKKHCQEIGEYRCQGFDTFGPFKLVGGIAKGHPTEEEIKGAVAFYQSLK